MNKDELVSVEVAILARKAGFQVPCRNCFSGDTHRPTYARKQQVKNKHEAIARPTQTKLQRWLREVHDTIVVALPYTSSVDLIKPTYIWMIYKVQSSTFDRAPFKTYEEALESGLERALEKLRDYEKRNEEKNELS